MRPCVSENAVAVGDPPTCKPCVSKDAASCRIARTTLRVAQGTILAPLRPVSGGAHYGLTPDGSLASGCTLLPAGAGRKKGVANLKALSFLVGGATVLSHPVSFPCIFVRFRRVWTVTSTSAKPKRWRTQSLAQAGYVRSYVRTSAHQAGGPPERETQKCPWS